MNNIKIIKKKREKYVYTKLLPTQSLNQREIELLGNRQMMQLITPQIIIGKKPELMYNVNSYMSLRDYLKNVTSKNNFLKMVLSILDMMKEAQQKYLYVANFILDIDYIFVDPATKDLRYIYIPVCNYEQQYNIKTLLVTLAYNTVFNQLEDCAYVSEYISYFNTHPNFSIYDFEMFVREMNGENAGDEEKEVCIAHPSKLLHKEAKICLKCNITYLSKFNFCEKCGDRLTFITPSKQLGQSGQLQNAQPVLIQPQAQQTSSHVSSQTMFVPQPEPINTQCVQDFVPSAPQVEDEKPSIQQQSIPVPAGTTVLGMVDCGTTVLSPQELGVVVYPYLLRKNNSEKVIINSQNFTIGQGSNSDYVVIGNTAVSRKHATIITKSGKYFIIDNKSTNGTYIDDVRITPDMEIEIVSGQRIRFANEEYEFLL